MESNQEIGTVAITGASGGLGTALVRAARKQGWRVRALITPSDPRARIESLVDELLIGSIEDSELCDRLCATSDVVINCAALLPPSLSLGEERFFSVNVRGAENLLQAAQRANVRHALFLSTIGVLDHTIPRGKADLYDYRKESVDSYSRSKIAMEVGIRKLSAEGTLPVTLIRPGFIYGPHSVGMWRPIIEQLESGAFRILGDGNAPFPVVYEDDLAEEILGLALSRKQPEPGKTVDCQIIACPFECTAKEVFCELASALKVKSPRSVPISLAYFVAAIADALPPLLRVGPLKLLTRRRVREYSAGYGLGLILRQLGQERTAATPLSVGFSRMVALYRGGSE